MIRGALALALLLVASPAMAQELASLTGRVVGGPRNEDVPFAALSLLPQGLDAEAGPDGRFRFDGVQPGPVELVVAADGWRRLTLTLDLRPGEELEIEAHLRRGSRPANRTVVRVDPPWREIARSPVAADRGLDPGKRSLTARDLERQPGTLGDPFRALQALPETGGDVGNQAFLQLRGGTGSEVVLEIDGIRVREPVHMASVVSVFQRDLLDSLDLHSLGTPASRPDGLSGGLFARYRRDSTDALDGTVDLSFLAGSLALQARIDPRGKHHLVVGARQSFLAAYLAAAGDAVEGEPPAGDYGETFLRYTGEVAPRHHVSATLLLTRDSFQWDDLNEQHWLVGGSLDWRHEFALDCSIEVQLAQSSGGGGEPPTTDFEYPLRRTWRDDTHRTHLRAAFRHGDRARDVAVGVEASLTARDIEGTFRDERSVPRWSWLPLAELNVPLKELRSTVLRPEVIVWGEVTYRNLLGPLGVRAGVRASLWNASGAPYASPNVAMSLPLPSGTTISGTFALMHQLADDALVVDPTLAGVLAPERAFHFAASVDQAITDAVVVRVEGWHKLYDHLLVFPDGPDAHTAGAWTNDGYGEASGLEVNAQARVGRLDASLGYGLSRSVRTNPLATTHAQTTAAGGDRRHFLHAGADLALGRNRGLLVGADYLFRTGWAIGSLERHTLDDGFTSLWGVTALDDRRRPDLHRVSLRVEGTHLLRRVRIRGYVEVAATVGGGGSVEDCASGSATAQLPSCRDLDFLPDVMPWAGLRADF